MKVLLLPVLLLALPCLAVFGGAGAALQGGQELRPLSLSLTSRVLASAPSSACRPALASRFLLRYLYQSQT